MFDMYKIHIVLFFFLTLKEKLEYVAKSFNVKIIQILSEMIRVKIT